MATCDEVDTPLVDGVPAEAPEGSKSEADDVRQLCEQEPDIEGFEKLDKWHRCEKKVGKCEVYKHNLGRAKFSGFPSALENAQAAGLNEHEGAALFGWTTGDFRFLNPIARGLKEVTFEDYPSGVKTICTLSSQEVLPYVQVVSSALRKLPPAPSGQTLWRGHRRTVPSEVGSLVIFRGFTSTSYNRDESLTFAAQPNAGRSAQRSLLGIKEHVSGRIISKFSARRQEAEVLFPVDTCFEVVPASENAVDDAAAAEEAAAKLREKMPDAEIQVVYLREVSRDALAGRTAVALD
eukprot:TRINITY_DN19221_c0_g1_i1.p1 TRINITY_DN19221_c0_g1~~TRINITY_DN19221_c0_g1_i1.p1  ORF type:complete len:293 (+),score=48.74 TRINITY_DN19221_c0_g1_i1:108-986(+)